jgi:hypothetical protein
MGRAAAQAVVEPVPELPMRLRFGRMNLLQTLQGIDSADGAAFAESRRNSYLGSVVFGFLVARIFVGRYLEVARTSRNRFSLTGSPTVRHGRCAKSPTFLLLE